MAMFQYLDFLRSIIALTLMVLFAANAGLQYTTQQLNNPMAVDVCDHQDIEQERDKKENAQTDDMVKPDPRPDLYYRFSNVDIRCRLISGCSTNHIAIATHPPERASFVL